jgi:hypothetical protein
MQVIGNTFVGQKPGGVSSEALISSLLHGRDQAQAEATRQTETQRADRINLSNSFETEWAKFEENLLPMTSTPEGFAGAAQRYRSGLELRNRASGNTLTPEDLDRLTAQWVARVQALHSFAGQNQEAKAAEGAAGGGSSSASAVKTSGGGAAMQAEAPVVASQVLGPADPRGSVAYERASEGPVTASAAKPRSGPPTQAQYTVPAPGRPIPAVLMDNWILTFTTPEEARAYAQSAGLKAIDVQPADLASAAQEGRQIKQMGAPPTGGPSGRAYSDGGEAPATPGGFLARLGDGGRTELVLPDAAAAAQDPLAAVRAALGQGVPPAQPMPTPQAQQPSLGGGVVPIGAATGGISPVPPSLQVGAQPALPVQPEVSAPGQPAVKPEGQATLIPKSSKVEAVVAKAASTTSGLATGLSKALDDMQTNREAGKSSKSETRVSEAVVGGHLHDILRNVNNITALPEYKAFLKSIDKTTGQKLLGASPEALIAIGMKDVGQAKLNREFTMAQIKSQNDIAQLEMAARERIAALDREAQYGSQMAQTTLTAAEIASKYIDSQSSLVAAQEKAGKTMAQIYTENPKLWESQQILSKTYGVPLTAVPDLVKKRFFAIGPFKGFGGEYGYRAPTSSELQTYQQLDPGAGVTKSARGSVYGTSRGAAPMAPGVAAPAAPAVSASDFAKSLLKSKTP